MSVLVGSPEDRFSHSQHGSCYGEMTMSRLGSEIKASSTCTADRSADLTSIMGLKVVPGVGEYRFGVESQNGGLK